MAFWLRSRECIDYVTKEAVCPNGKSVDFVTKVTVYPSGDFQFFSLQIRSKLIMTGDKTLLSSVG